MVTITEEARKFIECRRTEEAGRNWYLIIHWRKGEMENWRSADGSAIWERRPDPGWAVELVGHPGEVQTANLGETTIPGVGLIVEPGTPQPFPGGAVVVEEGSLKVRVNAG